MATESSKSRKSGEVAAFVRKLQNFVESSSQAPERSSRREDLKREISGRNIRTFDLEVSSEGAERGGLRTTHPSNSLIEAHVPRELEPSVIDFYMTRPRRDGSVETRFIGRSKYPDSDGTWRIDFTSKRFARSPNDPVVVHGELSNSVGEIIAIGAVGVVE